MRKLLITSLVFTVMVIFVGNGICFADEKRVNHYFDFGIGTLGAVHKLASIEIENGETGPMGAMLTLGGGLKLVEDLYSGSLFLNFRFNQYQSSFQGVNLVGYGCELILNGFIQNSPLEKLASYIDIGIGYTGPIGKDAMWKSKRYLVFGWTLRITKYTWLDAKVRSGTVCVSLLIRSFS